jgi:hypothetical protein
LGAVESVYQGDDLIAKIVVQRADGIGGTVAKFILQLGVAQGLFWSP